jgi:integrase
MGVTVRQKQPGKGNPWWVFINHKGKRKAKCVGDKKAAEHVASLVRQKLTTGEFNLLSPERAIPCFKDYARKWLDTYVRASCKETTYPGYETALRVHILPALGGKRLNDIQKADVKELIFSMAGKGSAGGTILNMKACLSGILTSAVEDGFMPSNPAAGTRKLIKKKDRKSEIGFLTRDEVSTFLQTVRDYLPAYYPLFLCALRTGMRIGEMIGLEWGDIDFNGSFIEVRRAIVRGKVTTPKNGKTRRIDMSQQLSEVLKRLKLQRRQEWLAIGSEMPERVFFMASGADIDLSGFRRRVFYKCLEKAGLRRIRIHDLRHTFASLLIAQGESLVYVRDQLGHSSITITVDTYGHLVPGANRSAVDKLDDAGATTCNLSATKDQK